MLKNFDDYKNELDQVRLTEGSKKALAESLRRRQTEADRSMRKGPLKLARIAAAAAVVCLLTALTVPAIANMTGEPTLGNAFTGNQAGYDQSSGVVGRSVERDGWTITVTDCVGDDFHGFLGVEVEAPEGTVLDAEYYEIYVDNEYYAEGSKSLRGFCYSLPDGDPTDNKIHMIYDWSTCEGESNHLSMRLKLVNLTENRGYNWDERNWDRPMVKEGEWDFGWIDIDYADNAIRLEPMVEIPGSGLEGGLVLSEVVISPVGLYIRFDGPEPYYVDWCDNWFMPNVYDTIQLFDVDGSEIYLSRYGLFYGPSGTYISFTDGDNAMNTADCDKPAQLNLVDLDRIGAVSVAGIMIPIR